MSATTGARIAVHTASLEDELRAGVDGEVRFDAGSRALYATDASNFRQVPIAVVVPRSVEAAVEAIGICHRHQAPVLSRGGGTSLAGQCCNAAVVLDWSKYLNRVRSIDPEARLATVEPGVVLDELRRQAAGHGLTFGPDPATHNRCTLGGMIGNNSCGIHSVMAGRTADNVRSLEIVTYDGLRMTVGRTSDQQLSRILVEGGRGAEIYRRLRDLRDRYADQIRSRYPDIPRRVSGYNLDELLPERGFDVARALVGTESTCVTVLSAEVELIPDPPSKSLLVLGYPDVCAAADHVPEIMAAGPCGLEGVDHRLFRLTSDKHLHPDSIKLLPDGRAWLFVEFGGASKQQSDANARALMTTLEHDAVTPSMRLFDDPQQEHQVWEVRESGLAATAHEDGTDTWPGWEDSAVPPERLGDYLRDLQQLFERYGFEASLYGHFGQGCVHTRIPFDLRTAGGVATYRSFVQDAAGLVVSYGGSFSGEHGDGQQRAELLPRLYGDELVQAFAEFKAIWDPTNKMNPGKVVHPNRLDENLRLGTSYQPAEPATFFAYPDDEGSFARAAGLRCVGVGKCRREDGGTMCPSYMVTKEEMHSTRGRARLLFEMLRGEVITDGWRSQEVRQALDLCLACKGCKSDCPVNVDMATYKAEFLAHHYRHRLRPAAHYSMGWLPVLAKVAARAPRLANRALHGGAASALVKRLAGLAPQRTMPRFASCTLQSWARRRPVGDPTGPGAVVLWPDTFTNHFEPHIGRAAYHLLEAAGFDVAVPREPLCCGLTWISTGQLNTAQHALRRTLRVLRDQIRAGTPVVVLEPSCAAVFRGDLLELWPHDQDAVRLSQQVYTLAELLQSRAPGWDPAQLDRKAIVQGHCHHKAIMKMDADMELLQRAGVDAELLDSGCCGLAGNWGVERGHYDISMACAERVLLPRVRDADDATLVLADGFSCRLQIGEGAGRRAVHLAEVLAPER